MVFYFSDIQLNLRLWRKLKLRLSAAMENVNKGHRCDSWCCALCVCVCVCVCLTAGLAAVLHGCFVEASCSVIIQLILKYHLTDDASVVQRVLQLIWCSEVGWMQLRSDFQSFLVETSVKLWQESNVTSLVFETELCTQLQRHWRTYSVNFIGSVKPTAGCLYPTTLLPLVWPVWQRSSTEHAVVLPVPQQRERPAPVWDAVSLLHSGKRCTPVLQNMRTRNNGTECIEKQSAQCSAPPTHRADLLAHNQSDNPMAPTADSQPSQTSHVESEQTTSVWFQKLLTQLNSCVVPESLQTLQTADGWPGVSQA